MGAGVADFESVGGVPKGIRALLQGGSSCGVAVWGGDVGPYPQDGAGHEYLSAQGLATDHREASKEAGGQSWEYPPMVVEIAEAGFEEIITYVARRKNTAVHYIATRSILELCKRSDRRSGV